MTENNKRNSAFNTAAAVKIYHAHLEDINKFTPDKFNHLRRGGIREGVGRNVAEMPEMLDKIPASQLLIALANLVSIMLYKDLSHLNRFINL